MKRLLLLVVAIVIFAMMAVYGSRTVYNAFKGLENVLPLPALNRENLSAKKACWAGLEKSIAQELKGFDGTAGVVIKDLGHNWEIVSNENTPIPSASMVKIPVMMSYFYASKEGVIDLNSNICITNRAKSPGSGLLKNVCPGENFTIEELIGLMITHSDNTAANILIDRLGFDAINGYFIRMGLKHTDLVRKMMDFKLRKKGVENYTTARDMANLLEMLYRNRFLNSAISKKCLEILAAQKVNDRIPKKLPAGTIVAHKTGLENGLCHDAGIVYTNKGNFLICILTKHNYKNAHAAKKLIADISLLTYTCITGN